MTASRLIPAFLLFAFSGQVVYSLCFPHLSLNRTLSASDLIMIFSGAEARVKTGFDLARAHYASHLAISGYTARQLAGEARKHHLPDEIGQLAQGISRSTFEDAYNTRRIVVSHRLRSVLLVTSSYHMPRAFLMTRLLLIGTGVAIRTYPVTDTPFSSAKKDGMLNRGLLMGTEIIKLWGNLTEMAYFLISGQLLLDSAPLFQLNTFIKGKMLSPRIWSLSQHPRARNRGLVILSAPRTTCQSWPHRGSGRRELATRRRLSAHAGQIGIAYRLPPRGPFGAMPLFLNLHTWRRLNPCVT